MRSFSMAFCSEINARCSFTLFLILLCFAQYEMPPDAILRPLGLYVWCYSIVSRKNYRLYITANKMKQELSSSWDGRPWPQQTLAEKRGALLCPFRWGAGSPYNNVAWAEVYFRTKWHLHPSSRLVTTDMDRKFGAAVPPFYGRSWVAI